ncbi:ROK family protein [Rathayibacter sp. CAU 1779]
MLSSERGGTSAEDRARGTGALGATLQALVAEVQRSGPLSRAQLGERLGLPTATTARVVARLIQEGVLAEAGIRRSGNGRPSRLVGLDPAAGCAIAVDVGASLVTTAFVDVAGGIRQLGVGPIDPASTPEARIDVVVDAIDDALAVALSDGERCLAIGVSVPAGGSASFADALADRLGARFELPLTIQRDADLLAMAEARWGTGNQSRVLVALAWSWGVGAGVVVDGDVYRGSTGRAGDIGRLVVGSVHGEAKGTSHDREPLTLEQRISVTALTRRLTLVEGRPFDELQVVDLLAGAADGTEDSSTGVRDLLASMLDDVAVAIGTLTLVLDPDVIVFSGVVGRRIDAFAPHLMRRLERTLPTVPRLTASGLGQTAWLSAAGLTAIESAGPLLAVLHGG